jgi:hypothetical protein
LHKTRRVQSVINDDYLLLVKLRLKSRPIFKNRLGGRKLAPSRVKLGQLQKTRNSNGGIIVHLSHGEMKTRSRAAHTI